MARQKLTEKERAEVRARACGVARQIVERDGIDALTIRAVTKAAGMSAMSLYTYFKNKSELVAVLQEQALAELGETVAAAADGPEPVRNMATAYADFVEAREADYRLAYAETESEQSRKALDDAIEPVRAALAASGSYLLSAEQLWSIWHGAAMLQIAGLASIPQERLMQGACFNRDGGASTRKKSPEPAS